MDTHRVEYASAIQRTARRGDGWALVLAVVCIVIALCGVAE